MLFTSHDEVNFEADADITKEEIEDTLNNIKLPWAEDLPFAVKVEVSDHYCK